MSEGEILAFCQVCGRAIPPGHPVRKPGLAFRSGYPKYGGRVTFDGVVCEEHNTSSGWQTVGAKAFAWTHWQKESGVLV